MSLQMRANVDVPDLDEGIRFYSGVFGFQPTRRLGDRFAELKSGTFVLDLLAKPAGSAAWPGATATREYGRHWTPVHLDFCVDDLDATLARAVAAGAMPQGDPRDLPFGRIVVVSDPFGHGLCIIQLSESGYDAMPGITRL